MKTRTWLSLTVLGVAAVVAFVVGGQIRRHPPDAAPAGPPAPLVARGFSRTWSGQGAEATPAPGEISVLTLLPAMIDLARLAESPAFATYPGLVSSHDRRSRTPEDVDGWFANDDFVTDRSPNLVRVEGPEARRRYVLADLEGPGAVLRIWTAAPAGTLRIYIDGAAEPALEAPMGALLGGEVLPFQPPFAEVTAMGANLYFPIPFRRHCTITTDSIVSLDPFTMRPLDRLYYQVGYETYDPRVADQVRSYAGAELERARGLLERTRAALGEPRKAHDAPTGASLSTATLPPTTMERGQTKTLSLVAAPGGSAIVSLRLRTGERAPEKLAQLTVRLAFDGEETVRLPVTAFFGTGPGLEPFSSWPLQADEDGWLQTRFVMPFRRKAEVTLLYEGEGSLSLDGDVSTRPTPYGERTLVFHAKRRGPAELATRPYQDWHVGELAGPGRLVGSVLDVDNPPGVAWWGEGDEKLYLDHAHLPSWFGTGTEDYFGFAWSSVERFAHPYHAQTAAPGPGQGFGGHFSMNRFHVLDALSFQEALRFDWELWHWSDTRVTMASTLYWYAREKRADDLGP